MNVIKIDISKNNDGGRFSKVYFAHGSHGSHGSFTTRFLNTNSMNYTNNLLHTDLTFLKHTDLTNLTDLPMLRMAHGCHFLSYITNPRIP